MRKREKRIIDGVFLLPEGEDAGVEGALDVDEALVAAAAETEGDVALGHLEGTVNEDVKFLYHLEEFGVIHDFFPGVARVAPDVVAQFVLDATDEGAGTLRLLQGVSAREGDGGFVIGYDLHQFVEGTFFPTLRIPRVGIMATWTTMIAASQID